MIGVVANPRSQVIRADSGMPNINVQVQLAILNAIPAPADDPLLDANGSPVLDANGNPVSDPNEQFHKVIPFVFDPGGTHLVESGWLDGTGCPLGADAACTTGDSNDTTLNDGLLLVKTGATSNNAAAGAELKKVRGITLTELGYDIRKIGAANNAGSHCGAGAPRFNVTTSNAFFFIGCQSPPATSQTTGNAWTRLRWGAGGPLVGFCVQTGGPSAACPASGALVPVTGTVQRIEIIFDEGTDQSGGPDQFGAAFLDNIDVNGTMVGRGGPNG
ncbi:MAG TPA: hypothetical protein VKE27_07935 [Candidatus Dormibacteraeota bacterium]|nr:hypothetical protein [Candidatus Dormibacteraeota bacterium]